MFKVENKSTKAVHAVYGVRVVDDMTLFLIYDKTYGWGWYDAKRYRAIECFN
jgi:hypothetical protein